MVKKDPIVGDIPTKFLKAILTIPALCCVFMILSLFGCSEGIKYKKATIKPNEFTCSNKAIVITRIGHRYKGLLSKGEVLANYDFAKANLEYTSLKTRHAYHVEAPFFQSRSDYNFLMIDPGTYVLENVSFELGNATFFSKDDGINPGTEHFLFGGFTVKPGEILYIGNINIGLEDKPEIPDVQVIDNYEQGVEAFRNKYPKFSLYPVNKRLFNTKKVLTQEDLDC